MGGLGCPFRRGSDMFGIPQRVFKQRLKPSVVKEYAVKSPFEDDGIPDGTGVDFEEDESEKDEFLNSVIMSIEKRRERWKRLREEIGRDSK